MTRAEHCGDQTAASYRKLFYTYHYLPMLACIVFFASACFVLFQIENYWLAAVIATPPTAAVLVLWVVRGRKLDRWICPECGQPLPREKRIFPRLDPLERCPSCSNPIL
jgi:hypothetical protein